MSKIRRLLGNPGGEELNLFRELIGLTPSQAMRRLAEEYGRRFEPDFGLEVVLGQLRPCRRWEDLDRKIRDFTVTLRRRYELMGMGRSPIVISAELSEVLEARYDVELDFWDKMRYLIEALPKTRDFRPKYEEKAGLKLQAPAQGWDFATCELCWRTVPVNRELGRKTGPLCFEHNLPAGDRTYRKRRRLEDEVRQRAGEIRARLKAAYPGQLSGQEREYRKLNRFHMTDPDSPLRSLVEHLRATGYASDYASDDESLLLAFHGPFPQGLEPLYQKAMAGYIQELVSFSCLATIDQLALAEAWLTALKTDRRSKGHSAPVSLQWPPA